MQKQLVIFLLTILSSPFFLAAQVNNIHELSTGYDWPTNPQVLNKLKQWQNLKFGMIIHWGLYSQVGVVESWELTSEDWINRKDSMTYEDYKRWYWGQKDAFNPVNFEPEKWAKAAKNAGMKYVVFTTKHHDGFNMFDTKESDFKITNGPFGNNPKANVAKYVFEAFRNEGMMIGAYFSKPDWHSQYFWWDKYGSWDRNVNYNLAANPERWEKFKTYAYNQVNEITSEYGAIDILWFDGGWVRAGRMVREGEQSIDIPKIATMARKNQPGILVVDRTVHGPYENYQTPERSIPDHQINNPWESCIPLANNWGFVPNDELKSSTQIIHSLVEIVAKGGSLLLGIGPKPDGTLREGDLQRMSEIGDWLDKNGKAIYGTKTTKNYQDGNTFFTAGKEGEHYAIVNIPEGETTPKTISWKGNPPKKGSTIKLLCNSSKVKWSQHGDEITVIIPKKLSNSKYPALTFQFTPAN